MNEWSKMINKCQVTVASANILSVASQRNRIELNGNT